MAEQKSRLVIEISTENAKRNAELLNKELGSIEKNGNHASKSMDVMSSSARQLASYMAGIVTVGTAINKKDAYSGLQNRLKLVTHSQTELNRAMSDTFVIAQKSYATWDSVLILAKIMTEKVQAVAETSAAAIGSKASLTGGAASAAGFFMGIDWMGWVGIGVAVLGLIINVYFSWQRNQREKMEHELRMSKLREDCHVED